MTFFYYLSTIFGNYKWGCRLINKAFMYLCVQIYQNLYGEQSDLQGFNRKTTAIQLQILVYLLTRLKKLLAQFRSYLPGFYIEIRGVRQACGIA